MGVLQSLILLWKGKGERKEKKSYYDTGYSYFVTQRSRNPTEQGFALLIGQDMVLPFFLFTGTSNSNRVSSELC